ncbi:MAG: hypothetical protein WB245_02740 [Acidimicrobiia bacterium]
MTFLTRPGFIITWATSIVIGLSFLINVWLVKAGIKEGMASPIPA